MLATMNLDIIENKEGEDDVVGKYSSTIFSVGIDVNAKKWLKARLAIKFFLGNTKGQNGLIQLSSNSI